MASKLDWLSLDANLYPPDSTFTPTSGYVGDTVSVGNGGLRIAVGNRYRYNNSNTAGGQGAAHFYDYNQTTFTWDLVPALTLTNTNTTSTVIGNYATVCLDKLTNHYLVSYNANDSATAGAVSRRFSTGVAAWGTKVSTTATTFTSAGGYEQNVALHIDGLFLMVGRPDSANPLYYGKVHVYKLSTWATTGNSLSAIGLRYAGETSYLANLILKDNFSQVGASTTPHWGDCVHINSTYKLLFIGATQDQDALGISIGAVYVYHYVENTPTQWELTRLGKITAPTTIGSERFGTSITASDDGTLLFIGALNTDNGPLVTKGCVYTFRQNIDPTTQAFTSNWAYVEKLVDDRLDPNTSARFGASLSMTEESTLAIGVLSGRTPTGYDTGFIKAYTPSIVPYVVQTREYITPVTINNSLPVSLNQPITVNTATSKVVLAPIQLNVSVIASYTAPIILNVAAPLVIEGQLSITVASGVPTTVTLFADIVVSVITIKTIEAPTTITVALPSQPTIAVQIENVNIKTISASLTLYSFLINSPVIPVQIRTALPNQPTASLTIKQRTPKTFTRKVKLIVNTRTPRVFSATVSITTTLPIAKIKAPVIVNVSKEAAFYIPATIKVSTLPLGDLSPQGIGYQITGPEGRTRKWSCAVYLKNVDVSSRILGDIKVDITPNAARVASFKLRPDDTIINAFDFSSAEVNISYVETDVTSGNVIGAWTLFNGIVETPSFDTTTRVLSFDCTDNILRIVNKLTDVEVRTLTPLAKWSPLIYARFHSRWEYLLQRLETYPYIVYQDINKTIVAVEHKVIKLKYEFTNKTIIDGSLSVSLATSKALVNHVSNKFTISKDEYRETIRDINWQGDSTGSSGAACGVQMIFDAAASADSAFVDMPNVSIQPPSRLITTALGGTRAVINSGTELIAVGCTGKIAKRYVQKIDTTFEFSIEDQASISNLGLLPSEGSASIGVKYVDKVLDWFTKRVAHTELWSTASVPGALMPIAGGGGYAAWIPYPSMPASYAIWETATPNSPLLTSDIDRWMNQPGGTDSVSTTKNDLHRPEPFAIGEHIYDFDKYITYGTEAQLEEAYEVLKAKGRTTIIKTHRANQVSFTAAIAPYLNLGESIRVNTPYVKATGVVESIVHIISIPSGSATSAVRLACSTTKAFLSPVGDNAPSVISASLVINVYSGVPEEGSPQSNQVTDRPLPLYPLSATTGSSEIQYENTLGNHYYEDEADIQDGWLGHIAAIRGKGLNLFRVHFDAIHPEYTKNFTATVSKGTIQVTVPNDEFTLRG